MRLRLLVALALSAFVLSAAPADAQQRTFVFSGGPLVDLVPDSAQATDGAIAIVAAGSSNGVSTRFGLLVMGLNASTWGSIHGAHLHTGPCVAGDPGAAGSRYNTGGPPGWDTEVRMDFQISPFGIAITQVNVPFLVEPGGGLSIVIHSGPTNPSTGNAGARIACLPIGF